MFASLKKIFSVSDSAENNNSIEAEAILQELSVLESQFAEDPTDNQTQKKLMVKYNQAIKVYAASKDYRHHVDELFIKMDELRNTIRKNI